MISETSAIFCTVMQLHHINQKSFHASIYMLLGKRGIYRHTNIYLEFILENFANLNKINQGAWCSLETSIREVLGSNVDRDTSFHN
jgi:hypothetical protein